jgi:hypothetical protein
LQKLGKDCEQENKQQHKRHVERFNLKQLSEMEVRKQFQTELSNRLPALENLNDSEDIDMALENVKENIKISVKETRSGKR